jgi:hypothetical protein
MQSMNSVTHRRINLNEIKRNSKLSVQAHSFAEVSTGVGVGPKIHRLGWPIGPLSKSCENSKIGPGPKIDGLSQLTARGFNSFGDKDYDPLQETEPQAQWPCMSGRTLGAKRSRSACQELHSHSCAFTKCRLGKLSRSLTLQSALAHC